MTYTVYGNVCADKTEELPKASTLMWARDSNCQEKKNQTIQVCTGLLLILDYARSLSTDCVPWVEPVHADVSNVTLEVCTAQKY